MPEQIEFSFGKESGDREKPPFRAFGTWLRDGQIIRTADFSEDDLDAEISRRKLAKKSTAQFAKALTTLRSLNSASPTTAPDRPNRR